MEGGGLATTGMSRARSGEHHRDRSVRAVAAAAAVGCTGIATFQAALALGAPFGAAAWGGAHERQLPAELRLASAVSGAFWLCAATTVLARGGYGLTAVPEAASRWGTRGLIVVFGCGTVMNAASPCDWERFGWAPLAFSLAAACLALDRYADKRQAPSG